GSRPNRRPAFDAAALTARGELDLAEGRPGDAISVLGRALRLWSELEFPYEAAKARVAVARAHLEQSDGVTARMALEAARTIFDRLGATPGLAEVDELIGTLNRKETEKERAIKTYMFTDIVTSTDLVAAMGDEAWESLIAWHDRELRSIFSSCHGVEVNHAGDGFFVVFDSPRDAVEAGVRIQRRLAEHRQDHGYAPSVRIGIHTGAATMDGADFRGREVHLAARVGSAAGPDEVLVTAATLDTAGPLRYPVDDGRAAALKGISEPVKLHGVDWR
ncbi:MAG: adenylate/guanylate cyclase domain-containing protein, partial [Actinobacteria bacterium]|nr:adenylate/guanylate cyclase domain-containing protein [Actinomycetota bacterium]